MDSTASVPSLHHADERIALLDGVRDYAIFMLDPDGRVLTWNEGAHRITGYAADEILGEDVRGLFPPEGPGWDAERSEALRTGRSEAEGWRLRRDGSRFWANGIVSALRHDDSTLRGFATVLRDLTDRRNAEAELRASQELFHQLVDSIDEYAIFLLDTSGHVQTWNPGAQRIKGYTAAEIIGRHFSVFYPAHDRLHERCQAKLDEAERSGKFAEEGWRVRKDGSEFWASVVISAVRNQRGELIGFGKVTRDLTSRRLADEQLRQSELRLRQLIDSIQDYAVFMLDARGRVATWNRGAQRIKGYQADEIIGEHFSRFYPREEIAAGKCEYELAEAERVGRFEDEGWRLRKDGTRFWANVVISAVRSADGKLIGFSKVTRDLSERRRVEEERAARLAAEQASRTKDEFLAILGHELRNPLAPMVTAVHLMQRKCSEHAGKELDVMARQLRHMTRLVDDLLDVSRLARGLVELKRRPVDLREVLQRAVETAQPLIGRRRHQLIVEPTVIPVIVDADDDRLVQVFSNLLTNAAKYTPSGGQIRLSLEADGTDAIVEVRDNGEGIPAELMPHIFELFQQGPQSSERASGGLGIGLTLVRSLVELHGGRVDAHSRGAGTGSTFVVRIPQVLQEVVAARPVPAHVPVAPGSAGVVLLVDDNDDARQLTAVVLRGAGYDVLSAANGVEALKLARELRPDIAILDLGLPIMDGTEVAARLQSMFPAHPPKLVALTGYGGAADRERSLAAGFQHHLVKPVDVGELLKTIG